MEDPITVSVVGMPDVAPQKVDGVAKAKAAGLALLKAHPSKWVEAKRPSGETVHAMAPTALYDGSELVSEDEPPPVLPGQEGIF